MPNEYYPKGMELNDTERSVILKLQNNGELNGRDSDILCLRHTTNLAFYPMAISGKREEALDIAAQTIVDYGQEIKKRLDQNDEEVKNIGNLTTENASGSVQNPHEEKAVTADINKISGTTLSEVITKITEILHGKTGDEREAAIANFSAMFVVLNATELKGKFLQVAGMLEKNPTLAADISGCLKDTEGGKIFNDAVDEVRKNVNEEESDKTTEPSRIAVGEAPKETWTSSLRRNLTVGEGVSRG